MVGIYFSGTGNTKHCVERFLKGADGGEEAYPLENPRTAEAAKAADEIVFAYPVYYSNLPKIVRDFITDNSGLWRGKRIFIICTMGLFSGDGAGCAARLFKRYGARVTGGLHLKMPDCIGDVKLLKKPLNKNRLLIKKADEKIDRAVEKIARGKYPKNGLGVFAHIAGLFGQRLYFNGKTKKYFDGIKADESKCIGCGSCASVCPMRNIGVVDGKAKFNGKCTMCYRCFSSCPGRAITLIGKRVYEQSKCENYTDGEPF
ncbi:MAG: EFR1 family ferrodoxin [Clostridia bacterium]|nr:EFR1 family ferrodoxin [Clostridia bacterium]